MHRAMLPVEFLTLNMTMMENAICKTINLAAPETCCSRIESIITPLD